MKYPKLHDLSKRAAALVLTAALLVPSAFASAGTTRLSTSRTLADGLTYINTISEHPSSGRIESFSFQLEPDSDITPIMVQSSGTIYGAATINKAVSYAESLGYHVVGGINSDFFTMSSGIPNGISIEDGVYKSSPEGNHAISVVDGRLELSASPQVELTLTNRRDGSSVSLTHFNKWRNSSGGLYLYNEDFSSVSTRTDSAGGRMVRFQVAEDDRDTPLTVNGELTLEVTEVFETQDAVTIGEDNYILTAAYESGFAELFASYQVGDKVTLSASCSDRAISDAQWAGGCGDIMIAGGKMTDSSTWHYATGQAPRTAVGVKEDGTMVFYAVDGRQSGYSAGLTQKDLADELLQQGCQWAVNLDGGGSTTLSVLLPGSSAPAVDNSPSGGSLRACATFILLVTDAPTDREPERLALREDGLTVLTGSSLPLGNVAAVDSGAATVSSRVSDAEFSSQNGLGSFNGSIYTAGDRAGTDEIAIRSRDMDLKGSAQIHVVDALTSLTVSKAGGTSPLTSLSLKAGESVQLTASGSYWSREALRPGSGGVTWSVEGDVGSITPDGVFTSGGTGSSGTITATAGGLTSKVSVGLENVHNDVTPEHWSYPAVEYCYEHGIVSGVSSTEFGRDRSIRRGDFVLMLYNALGKPAVTGSSGFSDVAPSDYYAQAITWASANHLVSGVAEGLFGPTDLVTREQAFTILHQAMPLLGLSSPEPDLTVLDRFADRDQIAEYARPHAAALVSQGLASGAGGVLNPKGQLTRAEMAALLYQLLTYDPASQPETPETPDLPEVPEVPETPDTPDVPDVPQVDPDAQLILSQTEGTLASAETLQLTARLSSGEGPITWRSSDPSVAAVSPEGVVTNVYAGSGEAAVTITASCGPLTAEAVLRCGPAGQIGVVTAEPNLRVRSGPSQEEPVISHLNTGSRVVLLDTETPGWYQVLFSDAAGQAVTGWASADYIRLS